MPLIVKICGLKTPEALDVALESGADLVGFVFFAPSPRHLGLPAARALGERVKGRAGKVALTVDADDETLGAIVKTLKPDMLQLHRRHPLGRLAAVQLQHVGLQRCDDGAQRLVVGIDRERDLAGAALDAFA